jgi:hypothetical protein
MTAGRLKALTRGPEGARRNARSGGGLGANEDQQSDINVGNGSANER